MLVSAAESHDDFTALSRYLIHGKQGEDVSPDRVAWIAAHNLATADPELAAKLMAATAHLSARVEKPTYHASISWHPDEDPAPEEMRTIAGRTLELMGLGEHQALIVGHGDTEHPHLHMMINRVHPGTGTAWRTSHDYLRFDRVMKLLAEEHGFTYVPAHRFNVGDAGIDALPKGPTKPAYQKARREKREPLPRMSRKKSKELGKQWKELTEEMQSWEDVEIAVALHGYRLEPKGQGLVLEGEGEYATFSSIGASMKALEQLFAEPFSAYRQRPRPLVDGIDIVKALASMGLAQRSDVTAAVKDLVRHREERPQPLWKQVAMAIRETFAPHNEPTR